MDKAATGAYIATRIVQENRGWIIARFGDSGRKFIDYTELVNNAMMIYGGVRLVTSLGKLVANWKSSHKKLKDLVSKEQGLDDDQLKIVKKIDDQVEEVVQKLDDVEKEINNLEFIRYNKYWDDLAKKIAIDRNLNGKLSKEQVRSWYLYKERQIMNYIDKSLPLKDQAAQAWAYRNYIRVRARDLMADRERAARFWKEDPNWSWQEIINKYKDRGYTGDKLWSEIINAAQRSRKSINKTLFIGE